MSLETPPPRRWQAGTTVALLLAVLAFAACAVLSVRVPMPPTERGAALSVLAVLALATALPGSPTLYDSIGRTVRASVGAYAVLLLLLPALYTSYTLASGLFTVGGALAVTGWVVLLGVLFRAGNAQRTPTLFDALGGGLLLAGLGTALLPAVPLPQQGAITDLLVLGSAPLLLLLLAARSWAGMGYSWVLRPAELLQAVQWSLATLLLTLAVAAFTGGPVPTFQRLPAVVAPVLDEFILFFSTGWLLVVPQELFFRGFVQRGLTRTAEVLLWRGAGEPPRFGLRAGYVAIALTAALCAVLAPFNPLAFSDKPWLVFIAAVGFGLLYHQTGKTSVSLLMHTLFAWGWGLLV